MSNYSKGEKGVMAAAFAKLFKVNPILIDSKSIRQWMENSPITIVEYEGYLKGEKSKVRDRRMELYDVYDGNISMLVNYLRDLYPEHKSLSKWELIFKVCSGILDVQKVIEQAELQVAFGKDETTVDVPQTTEEQLSSQSSSTVGTTEEPVSNEDSTQPISEVQSPIVGSEIVQPAPEPVEAESQTEENVEVKSTESIPEVEDVEHKVQEENSVSQEEVSTQTEPKAKADMPSGNVHNQKDSPLFDKPFLKENNNMEVKTMSGVDELLQAANAANAGNPGQEQVAPMASNVSTSTVDEKEAQQRVAELLGAQKEQRNAWTRQNVVTALVSTQKPSALRTLDEMGIVTDEQDPAKIEELVTGKINKYIAAVSGVDGITIADFEALPEDKKYANVVKPEQVAKAAAIYELYKQIKQNPTGKYAAFIPGADKVSYPTKGYVIGSQAFPVDEFIVELIDNGNGVIYGEGSCDANGNDVGEKPVVFSLGIAKRTEKASSTGITGGKKETRVPVVRPKNKKEFISDGTRIVYLFTKEDQENTGKASFKAAVNVNGQLEPATVSVYALENGVKKQRGTDKDGNATYKTKVASCSVSVPVTKIVKEFEARFRGDEDITVTAGRWGVNMSIKAQKGNYGQIAEFSQSPIFDVFTDVYAGTVTISAGLKGSNAIAALRAAANEQAAADAQASAEDLV